jgi:hypothetical protein
MNRIAHIVHPGEVPPESDLRVAQPVTFESMRIAQAFARGRVDVSLFAVKHADESPAWPAGFARLPDLERTVCDVASFEKERKFALVDDILGRLAAGTDADYLIYTNVDIALQPYFYTAVSDIIDTGVDAFSINRRSISDVFTTPLELNQMYAEVGQGHPGHDCFVFKRQAYARFCLGQTSIGCNWIGRVMLTNLMCTSPTFESFTDLHLTFHIGDAMAWRTQERQDYDAHNNKQLMQTIQHFKQRGQLAALPLMQMFAADAERKHLFYLHGKRVASKSAQVLETVHPLASVLTRVRQRLAGWIAP